MKKLTVLLIILIAVATCDWHQGPEAPDVNRAAVSFSLSAETLAKSTYKITISGNGMEIMGPEEYDGGQTIELYVPQGTARLFRFEHYDSNSVLIDTGASLVDIVAGMNVVPVTLISAIATYTVTYSGNNNTGGTAPSLQTKTHKVALTLASNTGSLVNTGFTFTGWNTAADGLGTDYTEGGSYTADATTTLFAKWTALPTYTVTYDGNSSNAGTVPSLQTKTHGVALTLASNTGSLVKTGFTFAGWNSAADGLGTDYAEGGSYTTDTIATLYAKWTDLPTYTITYSGNNNTGGTTPSLQIKTQGVALTLAANTGSLVKTGFTFAGWNSAADGLGTDYAEGGSYTTDTMATLYAKWSNLPTYTVTYVGNGNTGGTAPSPQTKIQGVALTLAANNGSLARTGFTFTGWNTAADGLGTDYAIEESYTADTTATLYAKWTNLPTYPITYSGNGNTGGTVPSSRSKIRGVPFTISENTGNLAKTGFTFTGWNTAADGLGTDYAEGGSYTADTITRFFAKWTALATYTVTYDGNGNTGGTVPSPQTKTHGVPLALSSDIISLAKTGFTFTGWNSAADGSGSNYSLGGTYSANATVKLYAKWTPVSTYIVMYDGNNNTSGTMPTSQTKSRGVTLILASNTGNFAKTGFTFTGWNTAADGLGTDYAEGGNYNADVITTLYAKWTPLTYTVAYDGNSSTGGTAPSSQTKTHGVALTLASNTGNLVRAGFTFTKWNTAADGLGTDYAEGGSYTADTIVTLYAKWTPLPTYTVTYSGNGSTGGTAPSPQTKTHGIALTLASNSGNLVRTDYIFAGWNTAADSSGTNYAEGGNYTADAIMTLYAKWVPECNAPNLPVPSGLTYFNEKLPDPFKFYDGTVLSRKADWPCRRKEILAMAGKYLYGPMPPEPDEITGTITGTAISATVRVGAVTRNLTWNTSGSGEILCMKVIGTGIGPATGARSLTLNHDASPIAALYGYSDITATISIAWQARIICAVIDQNPGSGINPDKIMVTGCSGAGKIAMTTGAFCEGIDLTVIVESGGGGASSLRMAECFRHGSCAYNCPDGLPQGIDNLEENGIAGPWVAQAANWVRSAPAKVKNLPFDQHLVLACIAPRACCHVTNQNGTNEWCNLGGTCEALSAWAAEPVWNALGVPQNYGFLIFTEASPPGHCSYPASATNLANEFFKRVFNGDSNANTNVMTIQDIDVQQPVATWGTTWIDWNMNTVLP